MMVWHFLQGLVFVFLLNHENMESRRKYFLMINGILQLVELEHTL